MKINQANFAAVTNNYRDKVTGIKKNIQRLIRHASLESGFSIIEVLIFTLLSSIVLIGMSYATLISIKNSKESQNKTLSTRYMQQAQEWLRGEKELDWNTFVDSLSSSTYCINTIPQTISEISTFLGTCAEDDFSLGTSFKRELTIVSINADKTEVIYKVQIYWHDGPNVATSQVSSLLAQWE